MSAKVFFGLAIIASTATLPVAIVQPYRYIGRMPPILLSVLIPSIPRRLSKLTELIACLEAQADPQLEVLIYMDNCKRVLGLKRNTLMQEAQGRYICHIDDDEMLADNFFARVKPELENGVDLVAYDALVSLNGSPNFRVRSVLGAANEQPQHLPGGGYSDITRQPWFWNCFRTDLARQFKFPDHHSGMEDWLWLKQILPEIKTWRKIDEALFFHRYSWEDSTFDGPRRATSS